MKIREVICRRWFLGKHTKAITLYPFIFFNGWPTPTIRSHEQVHVDQIRRMGVVRFYLTYLWYTIRFGYRNNPLETEAYKKQRP